MFDDLKYKFCLYQLDIDWKNSNPIDYRQENFISKSKTNPCNMIKKHSLSLYSELNNPTIQNFISKANLN